VNNLPFVSALIIDAFAIAIGLVIALREGRSALHPAWMFIGLHLYIVTFRLVDLYTGSHPMKATFAWPVAVNEVIRAGVASDMALLAMAGGWIAARSVQKRWAGHRPEAAAVSKFRLNVAAAMAMAIGIFGSLTVGRLDHALKNTSWDTSGYIAATTTWPAWSACLLHFLYGFPVPLLILTAIALIFVAIMNVSRFAIIISMIFMTMTWLSRRRSRRFPFTLVVATFGAWLIWLPMKPFTKMVNEGARVTDALDDAVRYTYDEFGKAEGSVDQQFLDMVAATMTLSDIRDSWYWGGTILPLFVSPIPRVLWPEKPKINQYQWDIQVPTRNMVDLGMTAGLVGEGYVNFGYAGVVLFGFGIGFAYVWAYLRIAHSHYLSPSRLLYFFCLAAASQVYRDGLVSAVWFPFVYAAPIGWTAVSHWIWRPGRLRAGTPERRTAVQGMQHVR
jgi:uncharacterized protein YhhL (DUF1145 family)